MHRAPLALALIAILPACVDDADALDDGPAVLADDKSDAATAIELQARLEPGAIDTTLAPDQYHLGYVLYAGEGAAVTLEVTHGGTSAGLDTVLKLYGPRLADGTYPHVIASDDDAGYGRLSKIAGAEIDTGGFYLVELTTNEPPTATKRARLQLRCDGVCTTEQPVAPLGNDLRWYQRAAERRALTLQAYQAATARVDELADAGRLAGDWGVVLDIDETTLDNSTYQRERADLGTGYSPRSWTAWVEREAAPVVPGVLGFLARVREHGGRVVLVTNRKAATECAPTERNLAAVGLGYDAILCRTASSDKNPRFASITEGTARPGLPALDVAIYVGDNIQDFPGMTQAIRTQPESAFAAFGDTQFLIPNPMYGSWESNAD